MALTPGQLPAQNEKFVDPTSGLVTRTWYRVLSSLGKVSGQMASPITVAANSFFKPGPLNSGATLEPQEIASGTLLGNSSGTDSAATPQGLDPSLELTGGLLSVTKIPAGTLFGNGGTVSAAPGEVAIGQGLSLVPGTPPTLEAAGASTPGTTNALAQTLSWWRGG